MLVPVARLLMPLLPDALAVRFAVLLASLPPALPLRAEDRKILEAARRFEFGSGLRRVGWRWGTGPTVVLVHGWGGRAGQMVKLAAAVADAGFEAVVFDGQGHGESAGRRVGFRALIEDLEALDAVLGDTVSAWVCHSAAGLCLAASKIPRDRSVAKIVFLAVPHGPYIPPQELDQHLALRPSVLNACRDYYASEFGASWETMEQVAVFRDMGQARLLAIQDRDDPRVAADDARLIAERHGNADQIYTDGLGHLKLLWSDAVGQRVVDFMVDRSGAKASPHAPMKGKLR